MPEENSLHRFVLWSQTAGDMKERYEHNKQTLYKELHRVGPHFFGMYDARESFVLLFFVYQFVQAQNLLYKRLLQGPSLFLPSLRTPETKELYDILMEDFKHVQSVFFILQKQEMLLKEFEQFEKYKEQISYNDILKQSLFSKKIDPKHVTALLQKFPQVNMDEKEIQEIHTKILPLIKEEFLAQKRCIQYFKTTSGAYLSKLAKMCHEGAIQGTIAYEGARQYVLSNTALSRTIEIGLPLLFVLAHLVEPSATNEIEYTHKLLKSFTGRGA